MTCQPRVFSPRGNTFNTETVISFQLDKPASATVKVYNVVGYLVRLLAYNRIVSEGMITRLYQREHILLPSLLETKQRPRSLAFIIGNLSYIKTFVQDLSTFYCLHYLSFVTKKFLLFFITIDKFVILAIFRLAEKIKAIPIEGIYV